MVGAALAEPSTLLTSVSKSAEIVIEQPQKAATMATKTMLRAASLIVLELWMVGGDMEEILTHGTLEFKFAAMATELFQKTVTTAIEMIIRAAIIIALEL